MFSPDKWFTNPSTGFYPHTINQSLRFNDSDNAYLKRDITSSSNMKTWTWSAWVKRASLGSQQVLFTDGRSSSYSTFRFNSDDTLYVQLSAKQKTSSQVFRDCAAWYHFVWRVDTTQATAADRSRIYVNGTQITSFSGQQHVNQDIDSTINQSGNDHQMGGYSTGSSRNFHGYMAEVNFVDGTSYGPDTFGETKDGVWIPKQYTGSYGTNGFHLDFSTSSFTDNVSDPDVFADQAGSNDFDAYNLAATDIVPDSPTNNFPTLNPLQVSSNITLAEGNLKSTTTNTSSSHQAYSTMNIPTSGKWYFECYAVLPRADDLEFGISEIPTPDDRNANHLTTMLYNASADACAILNNSAGNLSIRQQSGTGVLASSITGSTGDIYQIAFDCDTGKVFLGRNNTYYRVGAADGDPASGTNPSKTITANKEYCIGLSCYGGSGAGGGIINYGQDSTFAGNKTAGGNSDANGVGDFFYAVPTGFLALCTSNLPDITIGPGQSSQADDYFDTILYTAASSNGTHTHGSISFTPDWSWIKNRNNSERHFLTDVVRGNVSVTDKFLVSSDGSAEGANGVSGTTFSVTSSGYQFVESSIDSGELYYNSRTYVGWNWKAGGAPTTDNTNAAGAEPTAGSVKIDGVNKSGAFSGSPDIPVTRLSANTEAGFSIVKYAGVTANPIKIPHGLNSAVEFLIIKRLDGGDSWMVGEPSLGFTSSNILRLEEPSVVGLGNVVFTASPDANVFTVGSATNVNSNTSPYIAYCFHSVEGYSKVGSYVGNNDADGPFIYTGFRPAFILLKDIDASRNWHILDAARNPQNVSNLFLNPNDNTAEVPFTFGDFVSNGVKITNTGGTFNTNGETYIYLAFAEAPFKFANAR
tara:strand:- start:24 stop:2621 length:2598 start_codon:yes stop_codon:yes gene_type:complete